MKRGKGKIKEFIQSNRWLKCVPNTLTVCNSLCGFTAILIATYAYKESPTFTWVHHEYEALAVGACVILFAMVFDACDGAAARIFNAVSMHGVQMDSLADMVTFGVAPAVLSAIMAHTTTPAYTESMASYQYLFTWLCSGLYMACAALRLATYNVHAIQEKKSGDKFSGLPSPAAASAVCSLLLFYAYARSNEMSWWAELAVHIMPYYAAGLGLLMVSKFQYVHAFKKLQAIRKNPRQIAIAVIVLILLALWPVWTTLAVVNLYLLSAPLWWLLEKLNIIKNVNLNTKGKQA